MNESNEIPEQPKDPADALADLAGSGDEETIAPPEPADPLAALDEMAKTGDDASDPGEFAVAGAEAVADDVSEHIFGGAPPPNASGRQHVTAGDGHRRHHAHLYRKTMIPLLLVVGVLLFMVGLIAAAMLLQAGPEQKLHRWYSWMTAVTFVSFPLAAAMFFGAWWFHKEVNSMKYRS